MKSRGQKLIMIFLVVLSKAIHLSAESVACWSTAPHIRQFADEKSGFAATRVS